MALNINTDGTPRFATGETVKQETSTVYLRATIHVKDDPKMDVKKRIGTCFATLNRLNFFWKKLNCPPKFKLNVFDAVIRSKLVYGPESVNLTPVLIN